MSRYTLEFIPDEIAIQILNKLSSKDLRNCRLLSTVMRDKVSRIFNHRLCFKLNENSEEEFTKKPALKPNFYQMKVESGLLLGKSYSLFKAEYFNTLVELEFAEAINKNYFHSVIKLSVNLRILRLRSAALGGERNLFNEDSCLTLSKSIGWHFIKMFPKYMDLKYTKSGWENLQELHIKLEYKSPSTSSQFSPTRVADNLRDLMYIPVSKLKILSIIVEESKDKEMFYFEIKSFLDAIPTSAHGSLKQISIISPKFRPQRACAHVMHKTVTNDEDKRKFANLHLAEFNLHISAGYNHCIPQDLRELLVVQTTLEKLSIIGLGERDPLFHDVLNQVLNQNRKTLKIFTCQKLM